jgi:hypothetical protein
MADWMGHFFNSVIVSGITARQVHAAMNHSDFNPRTVIAWLRRQFPWVETDAGCPALNY